MKARWPAILAATLLLLMGCDVAPSELDGLSRANTEAYVVLRDQLDQVSERLSSRSNGATFCVTVRSPDDPEGLDIDPMLISRLQGHAPPSLKAIIIAQEGCPPIDENGQHSLGLYATFGTMEPDEWRAGYTCGGLCGQGNSYSIHYVLGYPVATRTGAFIN